MTGPITGVKLICFWQSLKTENLPVKAFVRLIVIVFQATKNVCGYEFVFAVRKKCLKIFCLNAMPYFCCTAEVLLFLLEAREKNQKYLNKADLVN